MISRQPTARVDRISQLGRIRTILWPCTLATVAGPNMMHKPWLWAILTSISLIAIQIKLIRARRCLHVLIHLNRLHPSRPAAIGLWLRPATIGLQHAVETDNPRRDLHIHERHIPAQEEGPGRVGGVDQFSDFGLELFGVRGLLRGVLLLQEAVEAGDYMAVYLREDVLETVIYSA